MGVCLSLRNVFLHILNRAFFAAINVQLVSPDIQAETPKSSFTVIVKLFASGLLFRHIDLCYSFEAKEYFLRH